MGNSEMRRGETVPKVGQGVIAGWGERQWEKVEEREVCYQPYRVLHQAAQATVGQCQLYVHTVYLVCACRQCCYSPGPSLLLCPQKPTPWSGPWCVQLLMSLKSRVLVLDLTESDRVAPSAPSWSKHHNLCLTDLIMHFQHLRVIANVK